MTDIASRDTIYIDGAWVRSTGNETIDVENPTTEEVFATIPSGTAADVDRAVAAAKAALPAWSATSAEERAKYIARLQEALTARMDEVARTIATEMGAPMKIASTVQAGLPIATLASCAQLLPTFPFEEEIGNSLVVKEPLGVVGCITPWNYPLHQVVAKVGPALAAGCTVVLKQTEVAPLSTYVLADVIHEVGLPAGVFNMVPGYGQTVGEAIAAHPDIDMVSFTGSTRAGKRVSELAAGNVKKVALELGGKSANLILPGADLAKAVAVGVGNCYLNSGQTCTAWTRMLVHKDSYDEAVQLAAQAAEGYTVGDPFDDATRLGPLVSAAQRDRVRGYIQKGLDEGARIVTGGAEAPESPAKGYFVRPTVFADVRPEMTIAQEEIFGPVLSIIAYEDEDDGVRIANDSIYGLAGGVWADTQEKAIAVARRIRTGQIDINGGRFNPIAPFGGYKQSGVGRELGSYGIEEFLQPKSLQR
ncbi:MAG TPA: aldehyde dehydrogenase family protein [Mycobacteriales bacterium]|nr:aldehyde dehydrogenase family protein [Mycobacteriales bacterium]